MGDLLLGAAIAVGSSIITILLSHLLTTGYNKKKEIQRLQSSLESYLRFLGNRHEMYFAQLIRWSYGTTLLILILTNNKEPQIEEHIQKNQMLENKVHEIGDMLSKEIQRFVENVCVLCRLKHVKKNDMIKMIWEAPFNIKKELAAIHGAKDLIELGEAFDKALSVLNESRGKYEEALQFSVRDILV